MKYRQIPKDIQVRVEKCYKYMYSRKKGMEEGIL